SWAAPAALLIEVYQGEPGVLDVFPTQHLDDGQKKYLEIQHKGARIDVPDIATQAFVPAYIVAAVDLGPTGHPSQHFKPTAFALGVVGIIARLQRPRADQAHVSSNHIPEPG